MVEHRICSFCGDPIEPGTGTLYIKKTGKQFAFCSSKCQKNMIDLDREPRYQEWTRHHEKGETQG
ncbi:50S ribosomal protein L24e [Thermoplasmatales archaeon SW_10_69_26]|jgi:large subunit ribosomal protein L24e|nr:MAG: 50S ribosomal protein L24e [Thermoplasmatales archaeon SW_10_69_26]